MAADISGNIQPDYGGQLRGQIHILGQHLAAVRHQQYVIKGQAFPNNLLKHETTSSSFLQRIYIYGLSVILSKPSPKVNAVSGGFVAQRREDGGFWGGCRNFFLEKRSLPQSCPFRSAFFEVLFGAGDEEHEEEG